MTKNALEHGDTLEVLQQSTADTAADLVAWLGWFAVLLGIVLPLLLFAFQLRSKQPKLRLRVAGSGAAKLSGKQVTVHYIGVRNDPAFGPFRLRRDTAIINYVDIRLPGKRPSLGGRPMWRLDGGEFSVKHTLPVGRSAHLYVFAKEHAAGYYFAFDPSKNELPHEVYRIYDRRRTFQIVMRDDLGRIYKFTVKVTNVGGRLSVRTMRWPPGRMEYVWEARELIKAALFGRDTSDLP